MKASICLVTQAQPSTNPRLVKEADALTEAGHAVHVVCAYWADWGQETDRALLRSKAWSCSYVGGDPHTARARYVWTRARHGITRRVVDRLGDVAWLRSFAYIRVLPELEAAAKNTPADLYIAHNLGALPPAIAAARKHHALVGFDAEDLHSHRPAGAVPSGDDQMTEAIEREYLPQCNYMTAASPGTADAYARKYGIKRPVPILNVFPLSTRPAAFRAGAREGPLRLYWFSQTIGPTRGLEDVVRALGELQDCALELHVRGGWREQYWQELVRLGAAVGVRPEQLIWHAPENPDEMARLAAQYDVGLTLEQHRNENTRVCLANKLFTYMLAGNALVTTDLEGQRALMDTVAEAGFCYAPGDWHSLARGLRRWYTDRAALEQARRASWNWGTRRYNWDFEKNAFLQVIEETLATAAAEYATA